jgi:hypothetical protein
MLIAREVKDPKKRKKSKVLDARGLLSKLQKSKDFLILMPDSSGGVQIISPREVDRGAVADMLEAAALASRQAA